MQQALARLMRVETRRPCLPTAPAKSHPTASRSIRSSDNRPCCTRRSRAASTSARRHNIERRFHAFELREDETCVARERFFLRQPGSEELRIATDAGEEILLTTECDNASVLSINFIGCCMPTGRCGLSTYGMWDTFAIALPDAAFSKLQCVSSTAQSSTQTPTSAASASSQHRRRLRHAELTRDYHPSKCLNPLAGPSANTAPEPPPAPAEQAKAVTPLVNPGTNTPAPISACVPAEQRRRSPPYN